MSMFHDSIRELLEDVHSFLHISLHQELLSANAIACKEDLLSKLRTLQDSYPQLQLSFSESEQHGDKKRCNFITSPSNPPPYIDMKGQQLRKDSIRADEEKYTLCDNEKPLDAENHYNESEDNQSYDGYKYGSVPANKTHYFEKYGYLEKKGKDVHSFLHISLHQELLSANAIACKEDLLSKLRTLQDSYPQLQLSFSESEQHGDKKRCNFITSPSNPPPYIDMKGQQLRKDSIRADEEKYTLCDNEKPLDAENHYNESEDNQSYDGYKYGSVPANKTHYFEKYGYLEKKGKERFGGLLSSSLKRWCAISQGMLYYYDKPADQVQKGVIRLEGYEARPVTTKDKKAGFCFELVCPGKRTYQFSVSTAGDMQQWILAIERNSKIFSECGKGRTSPTISKEEVDHSKSMEAFISEDIYEVVDEDVCQNNEAENKKAQVNSSHNANPCPDNMSSTFNSNKCNNEVTDSIINYSELYISLWDCSAEEDNELNFYRGDVIRIVSKEYDSLAWWIGELNGRVGFVPKSYLMEAYERY